MKQNQSTKLGCIWSLKFSIQEPIGHTTDWLHRLNFDLRLVSSTSVIPWLLAFAFLSHILVWHLKFLSSMCQTTKTKMTSQQPTGCIWHPHGWHHILYWHLHLSQNKCKNITLQFLHWVWFLLNLLLCKQWKPKKSSQQPINCLWHPDATKLVLGILFCPKTKAKNATPHISYMQFNFLSSSLSKQQNTKKSSQKSAS